jgi:hypothetical protein
LPVSAPEITTSCPAVEGSGEAEIVSAPGGQGLVQQPAGVQHAVGWQQVPDCAQHVVGWQQAPDGRQHVTGWQHVPEGGQQGGKRRLLVVAFVMGDTTGQQGTGPLTGTGQQGATSGAGPTAQRMWGMLTAAPAGLSIARTHNEATRNESDDGTIRRRIARNRAADYP